MHDLGSVYIVIFDAIIIIVCIKPGQQFRVVICPIIDLIWLQYPIAIIECHRQQHHIFLLLDVDDLERASTTTGDVLHLPVINGMLFHVFLHLSLAVGHHDAGIVSFVGTYPGKITVGEWP